MATLDEIRAAESEFLTTLGSLRTRVEQQNQAIVDLIARGNITQAEAEAINQRAAQINQDIQALQPLLRRTGDLINEGAGFFNRPAVNEIGTRIRTAVSSFSALAGQAGANREEMNRLATANQAAIKTATDAKAAADQGPGTASAGAETAEAQQANAAGANAQAPAGASEQANATGEVSAASANTVPSNADPATAAEVEGTTSPPKLTEGSVSTPGGFKIDVTGVGDRLPGLQVTNPEIATPEVNNNLVSYIYKATRVVSKFQQGKFTQDIQGVQIFFDLPRTQKNPDANRTVGPTVSTTPPPVTTNVARSQAQSTVDQTANTPGTYNSGVSYANQVGAEFAAFEGSGEIPAFTSSRSSLGSLPGSSFEAEGFRDPTQDQSDTVAPLEINPPSTENNTDISPARPQQDIESNTTNTALQQGAREY